jgi:ankyrin repeat protein
MVRTFVFRVFPALLAIAQLAAHAASPESARERLEVLGLPLGAGAFARAVAMHHPTLIDLCFRARLDPSAPDDDGRSPLLIAAMQGEWETARRLMNAGARAGGADRDGVTPLMAAAMHGNVEMLRAFLALDANAAVTDGAGRAAVHYAIAAKKADAVAFLLPLGADLAAPCADGRDAVAMAFDTGDDKIALGVLEQSPPLPEWLPQTRKALDAALLNGDRPRIRLLLSKHRTPPAPDGHTAPMFIYAIVMDDRPLFDILLECGASPNMTIPAPAEQDLVAMTASRFLRHYLLGDSGVTALMVAAALGRAEYVKALLAAGADRNRITPKYRMMALYFATRSDNWLCTQLLLGGGPSPDKLRIEISLDSQEAVVFRDGAPAFRTSVSTGRAGFSTPPGRYVITDKDRNHRSTIYKVPMPYFMRLSCRDFGMHQGYVASSPASHGCIRLPSGAARKLFAEIPVGTLVTID